MRYSTFRGLFQLAAGILLLGTITKPCLATPQGSQPKAVVRLAQRAGQLEICRRGTSAYSIVVAPDASPAEHTAAQQLQENLRLVTGVTLPIQTQAADGINAAYTPNPKILVGTGKNLRKALPNIDWAGLGEDGIVMKSVGHNIVLAGGGPRGALYAVFEFLESQVGCRWWTPTESTLPARETLRIAVPDVVYRPPFDYREHYTAASQVDALWATKSRQNGLYQTQDEKLGGHYSIIGGGHTFFQLLPPRVYFKEHPEWYSDPTNGDAPCTANSPMPNALNSQICLANEAARRELTRVVLKLVRERPQAGIISVSQGDSNHWCRCEAEKEMAAKEGTPSGALIAFVNAVAAEVEKENPQFLVDTFAYLYTQKPPATVRPRHNVLIRYAPIGADYARPLAEDANRTSRDDLLGWARISPHMFVWDYVTNFREPIYPYPNMRVLGPNLRYFAANNVRGIFEQGDHAKHGVGDFLQLRAWLMGKLMWNPAQDEQALITEFLQGYYGAAAPHLQSYLDEINQSFQRTGTALNTFQMDQSHLTLEVVRAAVRAFDAAQRAVADRPVLMQRVRRERLALDHVIISRYFQLKREAILRFPGQAVAELPTELGPFIEEYIRVARANGVMNLPEKSLRALIEKDAPLPESIARLVPRAQRANDIIDIQENRFTLEGEGTMTRITADPAASNGQAATIQGFVRAEVLHHFLKDPASFLGKEDWRCYIVARLEPKPGATLLPQDVSLRCGIFDAATQRRLLDYDISNQTLLDGKYHLIEMGQTKLGPRSYFHLTSRGQEGVGAIHIDRIIFVRVNGKAAGEP